MSSGRSRRPELADYLVCKGVDRLWSAMPTDLDDPLLGFAGAGELEMPGTA
jgi:hypothetical protein